MSILALNSGSTSLKFGLFDDAASWEPVRNASAAAACAFRAILPSSADGPATRDPITLVGHRVVHGGIHFRSSIVIDQKVKTAIRGLCDLAPLHNPPALETILAAEAAAPGIPHVAVFDTAFYGRLPRKACRN